MKFDGIVYIRKADTENTDLIIETDKSLVDSFILHLKLYKMRSKVDIQLLTNMTTIVTNTVHEYTIMKSELFSVTTATATGGIIHSPDPRVDNFLYRILYPFNLGNEYLHMVYIINYLPITYTCIQYI